MSRPPRMPESRSWVEVAAEYVQSVEDLKQKARQIYGEMVAHVAQESTRTGAKIAIMSPGTVLPKTAASTPLAVRLDVTAAGALYARQAHVDETTGGKHRSWRIEFDETSAMPTIVRRGLTRMVEEVARLQGCQQHTPQKTMDFG